jgi:hypothetical protein
MAAAVAVAGGGVRFGFFVRRLSGRALAWRGTGDAGNGGGGLPNDDESMRTILDRGGMKVDPFYISKRLNNQPGQMKLRLQKFGQSLRSTRHWFLLVKLTF